MTRNGSQRHRKKEYVCEWSNVLCIFLIAFRITPCKKEYCEYIANVLSVRLKYLLFGELNYINKQVGLNKIQGEHKVFP